MRIHITQTTRQFVQDRPYIFANRGYIETPGKGSLKTFLIVGKKDKNGNQINMPYLDVGDLQDKAKEMASNSKWEGFRLAEN